MNRFNPASSQRLGTKSAIRRLAVGRHFQVLTSLAVVAMLARLLAGCATIPADGSSGRLPESTGPGPHSLVSPDIRARGIQLYRPPSETSLPILKLQSGETLVLEFDLLGTNQRLLNIEFHHADRDGNLDLSRGSFFESFNEDSIVEFYFSYRTTLPYQHYVYTFPNSRIDFRASGTYLLRVTDPDDPDLVYFERMFLVEEAAGLLDVDLQTELVAGRGVPLGLPSVSYVPSQTERGSAFDYSACAIFNGQLGWKRCIQSVPVSNGNSFRFPSSTAVGIDPEDPLHYLDLRDLEDNRRIVDEDSDVRPHLYVLEPDPAPRFPGRREYLNGQTRVRENSYITGDPNTEGEYVTVRFTLAPPDGQPLRDSVFLIGSFSAWQIHPKNRMEWQPNGSRYVLDLVLKQGEYEYNYASTDRGLDRYLAERARLERGLVTVLIFYRDPGLGYDRLLAVETIETLL